MFLGHYGVAFALKRIEPRVSLGTLFFSVALVDTMWGVFLLTGWEQARIFPGLTPVTPIEFTSYPITHSLVAGLIWATIAGAIVYSWPTRDTSRHHRLKAVVVAIAVASHWFLDLVVHIPDLPLAGDSSPKFGLALWRSLPATLVVEFAVFLAGFALYLGWRSRSGKGRLGRVISLAGLLVILYLASLLGPPPTNMRMVAMVDIIGTLLLTALAAWADKAAIPEKLHAGEKATRAGRKARA
jgi:hypothetical protein